MSRPRVMTLRVFVFEPRHAYRKGPRRSVAGTVFTIEVCARCRQLPIAEVHRARRRRRVPREALPYPRGVA